MITRLVLTLLSALLYVAICIQTYSNVQMYRRKEGYSGSCLRSRARRWRQIGIRSAPNPTLDQLQDSGLRPNPTQHCTKLQISAHNIVHCNLIAFNETQHWYTMCPGRACSTYHTANQKYWLNPKLFNFHGSETNPCIVT